MPDWAGAIETRLAGLTLPPARKTEIVEELAQHLADRYAELRAAGMAESAARDSALAELDDDQLVGELTRIERPRPSSTAELGGTRGGLFADVRSDVRYAVRALRKHPGFAAVVVLTLALGIGANAAIFSVVNAVVLRPLPFTRADRLAVIWGNLPALHFTDIVVSAAEYLDFRTDNQAFDGMAAYDTTAFNLTGRGEPERVDGAVVTTNLFAVLGAAPAAGRPFVERDGEPGGARVAILSDALWRRRFGGDASLIGRTVTLDGNSVVVVGIMPRGFHFPDDTVDVWTPIVFDADLVTDNNRGSRSYTVIGRLKQNVATDQAQAAMDVVTERMAHAHPTQYRGGFTATVRGLQEEVVGGTRQALFVLLGAVGLVLLVACANVANLLLARAHARRKEVAIRRALGARRGRIVRQLLTESLVLAVLGGCAGLLLAVWGVDVLIAFAPRDIPRLGEITLDGRVVAFTAATATITGVLFGLVPAVHASHTNLHETLKDGGRATGGRRRGRLLATLVVSEMALALVLLIAAGLLINSLVRLQDVPPGFDPRRVLTLRIAPPPAKYTFEKSDRFYTEILARLAAQRGVEAAAAVNALPFSGFGGDRSFFLEGQLAPGPDSKPDEQVRFVTAGYFAAIRIPVRRGREFEDRDTMQAKPVAVVNEALARKYSPNGSAIGKRVTFDRQQPKWYEVVGVVANIRDRSLSREPQPQLYVPYSQPLFAGATARSMFLVVRTAGDPLAAAQTVRDIITSVDPDQPMASVKSMEQRIADTLPSPRCNTLLMSLIASVALLLAALGIYGVIAYSATERTHEIGVRIALGATGRAIVGLLVGEGIVLALAGTAVGIVAAVGLTRVMASLLFGVAPTDPATFAAVSTLLVAIALVASWLPARRATRVDPLTALRAE